MLKTHWESSELLVKMRLLEDIFFKRVINFRSELLDILNISML